MADRKQCDRCQALYQNSSKTTTIKYYIAGYFRVGSGSELGHRFKHTADLCQSCCKSFHVWLAADKEPT